MLSAGAPDIYPTKFPAEIVAGTPKNTPHKILTDFLRGPRILPHEKSCGFYAGTPELTPTKRAFQIRFTRAVNAKPPHSRASAAEVCEIFDIFHTHSFDTGVSFAVIFGKSD